MHPQPSRRQRAAPLIELRVQNGLPSRTLGEEWWEVLVMLRPRRCRYCFRDKCSQLVSACLPKMAARVGLAPTPCGLTNRRATLTPPGNGAAGRILTCIVPFRRRMPDNFDHGSKLKLVSAAGVAPAIPRSQAECVAATLRAENSGRPFETSEWRNATPKPWESASR